MARPWIFIHIPKTAGTSFRAAAKGVSGVEVHEAYPGLRSPLVAETDLEAPGGWAELLSKLERVEGPTLLSGHVYLHALPIADSLDRVATIVRDPVDHVLSRFDFQTGRDPVGALDRYLDDEAEQNNQSSWLEGAPLKQIGVLGLTEEFGDFLRAFGDASGIRVPLRRYNRLRDGAGRRREQLPKNVIKEIERRNQRDLELYRRVSELCVQRRRPMFSIVMPTYESDPKLLREAIDSVRSQDFGDWEMKISDDGSTGKAVERELRRAESDSRIEVERLGRNRGISAATNSALERCRGSYVALIDHDDLLLPGALRAVADRIEAEPSAGVIYTDQTKIDAEGNEIDRFHKPDWSPAYALGVMYVGHLLIVRRDLVERTGGCDPDYDDAQDFEWLLRLSELGEPIAHIPRALYAWRAIDGSIAIDPDAKPRAAEVQRRSVGRHLERIGAGWIDVEPIEGLPHRLRLVEREGTEPPRPAVSVVIPSYNNAALLGRCIDSIERFTTYPDFEVIVVDGGSTDADALAILDREIVTPLPYARRPFNYSAACNVGAERARGDVLLMLNDDTEVVSEGWLEQMVLALSLPGVGAVGPMLLFPDGTVQHAGVVTGLRGTADHLMHRFDADSEGYAGSLSCAREVSAVTGAAMMVWTDLYRELGGMEEEFATHYQDIDICLRIRGRGHRILYTPQPRLIHHEGASRGKLYDIIDRALMIDRHGSQTGDPYYNPSFSKEWGFSYVVDSNAGGAI